MPIVTEDQATDIVERILKTIGTPHHIAGVVARQIVDSELSGHASHGFVTLQNYMQDVLDGRIVPNAEPEITSSRPGFIQVDGRRTFGHYAMEWLIARLVQQMQTSSVCLATVRNVAHIGRLGGYVEALARDGYLAILTAGFALDPLESTVAPPGSAVRRLGTNPIAIGAPTMAEPFVFDASTARTTVFGLIEAARNNRKVSPGSLVTALGGDTTDPNEFFAGGAIVLFGGHKGFGLSIGTCLLGALSGNLDPDQGGIGGIALLAIKVGDMVSSDSYKVATEKVLSVLRTTPPIPGSPRVRIPGDQSRRQKEESKAHGISVLPATWRSLMSCLGNNVGYTENIQRSEGDIS